MIQSTALIAGISRDGVCMTGGLLRGLDNEHAAKFAFLLATPIILAAGLFKFPDLTGPLGDHGVRRAAVIAAVAAAVAAVVTVHFLLRYFRNNNLIPFGVYCLLFGTAMISTRRSEAAVGRPPLRPAPSAGSGSSAGPRGARRRSRRAGAVERVAHGRARCRASASGGPARSSSSERRPV